MITWSMLLMNCPSSKYEYDVPMSEIFRTGLTYSERHPTPEYFEPTKPSDEWIEVVRFEVAETKYGTDGEYHAFSKVVTKAEEKRMIALEIFERDERLARKKKPSKQMKPKQSA